LTLLLAKMPSSDPLPIVESTAKDASTTTPAEGQGEGKSEGKKVAKPQESATPADGAKISGAELKKQAKAEKAARRAQALQQKQGGPAPPGPGPGPAAGSVLKVEGSKGPKGQGQGQGQHKRGGSVALDVRSIQVRGAQKPAPVPEQPKAEDKTVEFFRHLYKPRTTSIAGASKDVHPAVLALGLQMSNYGICGSCARLVATLQTFKRVSFTIRPLLFKLHIHS
jgi:translation initiation factor eIF-2B subunit delta